MLKETTHSLQVDLFFVLIRFSVSFAIKYRDVLFNHQRNGRVTTNFRQQNKRTQQFGV